MLPFIRFQLYRPRKVMAGVLIHTETIQYKRKSGCVCRCPKFVTIKLLNADSCRAHVACSTQAFDTLAQPFRFAWRQLQRAVDSTHCDLRLFDDQCQVAGGIPAGFIVWILLVQLIASFRSFLDLSSLDQLPHTGFEF